MDPQAAEAQLEDLKALYCKYQNSIIHNLEDADDEDADILVDEQAQVSDEYLHNVGRLQGVVRRTLVPNALQDNHQGELSVQMLSAVQITPFDGSVAK